MDRIRAMENNLFAVATEEQEPLSSDPLYFHCPCPKSLDEHSNLLSRLSLYEQRLNRTFEKSPAQFKQLQSERTQAEARALETAGEIRNLKEALKEPWQPEQIGFEFSSSRLTARICRRQLTQEAEHFEYHGEVLFVDRGF